MVLEDHEISPEIINPESMAEMRVLAARDVLRRLGDRYQATLTGYVTFKEGRITHVCAVGGLLHALVQVNRLGNLRQTPMIGDEPIAPGISLAYLFDEFRAASDEPRFHFMKTVLTIAFTLEQIGMIEAAYMQAYDGHFSDPSVMVDGYAFALDTLADPEIFESVEEHVGPNTRGFIARMAKAREFAREEQDPQLRMVSIMQNIINHQGEFVP